MKSKRTSQGFLVILQKDELLIMSLQQFCERQKITGGFVTGLGAVLNAELGYYDLNSQQYHWKKFGQLMEITALNGTITEDTIHIHVTLSSYDFQTIGGHLKEATVGGTCELYIQTISSTLKRKHDTDTALRLINF